MISLETVLLLSGNRLCDVLALRSWFAIERCLVFPLTSLVHCGKGTFESLVAFPTRFPNIERLAIAVFIQFHGVLDLSCAV